MVDALNVVQSIIQISHSQLRQSDILRNLPDEDDEPISNTFDFEESNKLFDKEIDSVETTKPAYSKANFFDNLQERPAERFTTSEMSNIQRKRAF